MQLRHAARTDAGKTRDHNEDSYGVEIGGERAAAGALFVVCDGIGGYASGEVASDLAVKTIIARFYAANGRDPEEALGAAVAEANRTVFQQGGGKMGTTTVAALLRDDALIVANVGDCRAYLVRNERPRQITRDHSFVAEQVAAGVLTEEQARESSYRHIITRAIGHRPEIEIDLFREPLLQDDIVVLCSDGLHGQVEPDEIALAVTKVPLDDACRALIKLANDRGGPDNITVVAVQVTKLTFSSDTGVSRPMASSSGSTAKTARLTSSGAMVYPVVEHAETATLQSLPEGTSPTYERTSTTARRSAVRSVETPATDGVTGSLRSFLVWMITLLLLGALLVGGYVYFIAGGTANEPAVPAAPRTTQTPLVQRTPTLVPTADTTTTTTTTATTATP